jgi:hypothetical protein
MSAHRQQAIDAIKYIYGNVDNLLDHLDDENWREAAAVLESMESPLATLLADLII